LTAVQGNGLAVLVSSLSYQPLSSHVILW